MKSAAAESSPWLARSDWAAGRIASSQGEGLVIPWIVALASGGITCGYAAAYGWFESPTRVFTEPDLMPLVPFVLVSFALLVSALQHTGRAVRSGPSTLQLASTPAPIGGKLQGVIHGAPELREGQGLRLVLRCVVMAWSYSYETGKSYGNSSCRWEDDLELSPAQVTAGVPVSFDIPADALPSVDRQETDYGWRSVTWILEALGEPGSFWRGQYELPVFSTGSATPIRRQIKVPEDDPQRIARPPSSRITLGWTGKGLEIAYPRRGAFVAATIWFVLTLPVCLAPFLGLWLPQRQLLFGVGTALIAGLVLNFVPAWLLVVNEPRRVVVGRREIAVTCGWPLLGRTRRFSLAEFDGVKADPQFFSVLRKNASFFGRHFFLATHLESHAESRWLASEVERAVSRSLTYKPARPL